MSFSNQAHFLVGEKCIVNDNYCDGKTRCNECQVPTRKILVELYRTAFGTTELSDCGITKEVVG